MIKNRIITNISIFLRLVKYRLSIAISISALAGYLLFIPVFNPGLVLMLLAVFLLAGGSASLNQYQERVFDTLMKRTNNRPLPQKQISSSTAFRISIIMILTGAGLLSFIGPIPAILGLVNVVIYNLIYTNLKRITALAVFPGALVGAIPPLIGWTAAGGQVFQTTILYVSILIFLWQIPHFWLLMLKYGREYEQAGYTTILRKMTEKQIRLLVFIWMTFTSGIVLCFPLFNIYLKPLFTISLVLLNIFFILSFYKILFNSATPLKVKNAFLLTNLFLLAVFFILIVNSIV